VRTRAPGDDHQLQVWQARDQGGRQRHAFAHQAKHVERSEVRRCLVEAAEIAVEYRHLAVRTQRGPVRALHGNVLIIIEDRDFEHVQLVRGRHAVRRMPGLAYRSYSPANGYGPETVRFTFAGGRGQE